MKKLISIFLLVFIVSITNNTSALNNSFNNILLQEEQCVSNEEILFFVIRKGYTSPVIIEEIGCDRIVETEEALLYVYVAGGRIVGVEEIRN